MHQQILDKTATLILIVEDTPINVVLLGQVLRKDGYEVAVAKNGQEAVDFVAKKKPHLILMDMMMPIMGGIEACEIIKKDPDSVDIPVIFLTALSDSSNKTQAFKAGGVDYVTKPFVAEELLARVEVNVSRYLAENALHDSQKALKESNEALTEALLTKNKFFSIIAHDIKNPLWAILGCSEMLALEIDDFDKEDIQSLSQSINNSSHRLLDLLENLLAWSQNELNTITFNPSPISLKKEIDSAISILKDSARIKKITLDNKVKESIELVADKNMIQTIVRNLASNAIKFTPQDGSITIRAKLSPDEVQISVIDSGVGIPKNVRDGLFKLDGGKSTMGTNKEKGTGLGLLLCKEFVQKHDGKIWVESEEGKGSTFSFSIPWK